LPPQVPHIFTTFNTFTIFEIFISLPSDYVNSWRPIPLVPTRHVMNSEPID
jgi:hypothetical protein